MTDADEWLSVAGVADYLRIPVRTVRYWRQSGTGPQPRKFGRHLRYSRPAVDAWIAEQPADDTRRELVHPQAKATDSLTTRPPLSVNALVAINLAAARLMRRLTQEELGQRLEQVTGKRWSKATISALERSADGARAARQFDADDIAALARVLDVPIMFFFLPEPDPHSRQLWATRPVIPGEMQGDELDSNELVRVVVGDSDDDPAAAIQSEIQERMVTANAVDRPLMSPVLRKWRDALRSVANDIDRTINDV